MENRPRGREEHSVGKGKDVYKRGEGLGTGPVGSSGGYSGRPGTTGSSGGSGPTRSGGGGSLIKIILALVVLLGGGGAGLSGLLGGGSGTTANTGTTQPSTSYVQQPTQQTTQSGGAMSASLANLLGSYGNVSEGWTAASNVGKLNTSVAAGARAKRTTILGKGKDTVTIMVYMCGTDLESQYGMGTSDLSEMLGATVGDKVNLIVYTGGCKQWRNTAVSSSVNQVYQIRGGKLYALVTDAGSPAMTDPSTLASFIQYCAKNFPANRNELILWDHGGGSLSGYGYDEKNQRAGSMGLSGIAQALKTGGVTFDFIGFDACLMATLETALTLANYADYMIGSEETEPGVGWYYTNWLTALSNNTSMPTIEIGKNIADDFVTVCAQKCRGQDTTLSVIDLAELETTVPDKLKEFARGTSELLEGQQYQTVSRARSSAREFSPSNKLDQVDLVDLASKLGTSESKALAQTLLSAVKYNRTSASLTDAYGLSVYFPYQRTSKVDTAVAAYNAIGMDNDYTRVIQQFASLEVGGQAVSGGAVNPLGALLGTGSSSSSTMDAQLINQMLSGLLGGSFGNMSGLTSGNTGFLGRSLDVDAATQYLSANQFDENALVWTTTDGEALLRLSEEQWALVTELELNGFYDDGEGYIDLGLDNRFDFTDDGALRGNVKSTWLSIDRQIVPYYHLGTVVDGNAYTISGRVPCLLNGERADLLLVFDNEKPYGYIAGYRRDYRDGETETVAKGVSELADGDRIDFVCDYYSYAGVYQDSYLMGEPYYYHGQPEIGDAEVDAARLNMTYRLTDIYNQQHWTPVLP